MEHKYQNAIVGGLAGLVISVGSVETPYLSRHHQAEGLMYLAVADPTAGIPNGEYEQENSSDGISPGDRVVIPGDLPGVEYYFNGHDDELEGTFEGGSSHGGETFRPDGVPGKIPRK